MGWVPHTNKFLKLKMRCPECFIIFPSSSKAQVQLQLGPEVSLENQILPPPPVNILPSLVLAPAQWGPNLIKLAGRYGEIKNYETYKKGEGAQSLII